MKKVITFLACLTAVLSVNAQTWKLTEMADGVFAQGGNEIWSFEKFSYETSTYSGFTTFGDQCTVNYVDIYQPERVGGQLIQNIAGVTPNGEHTWAATLRKAWFDTEWSDSESARIKSNEKFVYVSRLAELDNAFEVCGNKQYTAAISFWVPEDGYYQVNGSVIRQDGANLKAIHVVPRFRYQGEETVSSEPNTGLAFAFGEGGSQIPGATNTDLASGANQRYTAQEPSDFSFAFNAMKGDVISFEVSYQNLPSSAWPRDYYPRAFYRQLNIEQVDQQTAQASQYFLDPYDETALNALDQQIDYYIDALADLPYGNEVGSVPYDKWVEFNELLTHYSEMFQDGTANALNAQQLLQQLDAAWTALINSTILFDINAQGNYQLFSYTGSIAEGDLEITGNQEQMDANDDQPWGFYSHAVSNGNLSKLTNHDANNKSSKSAWYRGGGQWFYITDNGAMHPLTDQAPAIMFTAPKDGIYRLDLTLYRPNPNPSVENPLYVRWFMMIGDQTSVPTADAVVSEQYGSVANDGQEGKKPISTAFYANLHQGDRVFMELDGYTAGSIASAGTQILSLTACSHISNDEPITPQMALNSGLTFLNPYGTGDCTALKAAVAEAQQLLDTTVAGEEPGQYPEEAREELSAVIAEAQAVLADEGSPSLTQSDVDAATKTLRAAIDAYLLARVPYTLQPNGAYAFQVVGTEKYLTKKNKASGDYYYGTVDTYEAILADINKNGTSINEYSWTFTITPVEGTNSVTITTHDGFVTYDGYVQIDADAEAGSPDLPQFSLVVESSDATTFAIRRNSDGKYWKASMAWKAPYNRIDTSTDPLYIWTLSDATVPGSVDPSEPSWDAFKEAVAEAEELLATTVGGTEPGQYPEEARYDLSAVIEEARLILEDETSSDMSQSIIDNLTKSVMEAIEAYKAARIVCSFQPEGDYAIHLVGTDKYLTKKNKANGDYYYATVDSYDAILADVARVGSTIEEYSWTFTITPVEDTDNVILSTPEGYMTADGYIQIISAEEAEEFTFVQEHADDNVFAIRRASDGKYWTSTLAWKSPYNRFEVSTTPLYIWELSTTTVTGIEAVDNGQRTMDNTSIYNLAGQKIVHRTSSLRTLPKGLYIVNGKKVVVK